MRALVFGCLVICATVHFAESASSQPYDVSAASKYDAAAADRWDKVRVVHYEADGVITAKQFQIPPGDYDLYADVVDRVHLSFDWDRKTKTLVGALTFKNLPGTVANITGLEKRCPSGQIKGPYEHFDIVETKVPASGEVIELVGQRVRPDTLVAESCGGLQFHRGKTEKVLSEYVAPPDGAMFAYAGMLPPGGPFTLMKDGKTIVMPGDGHHLAWTFTLTPK